MTSEEEELFGKYCPKCLTPWSFIPRIVCAGNWVHCAPCKKKAEILVKEEKDRRDEEYKSMKDEIDAMSFNYGAIDWGHKK